MQVRIGDQTAWVHDSNESYGYYHTYDQLCFDGRFSRKIHILLPRNYLLQPDARFPVIYANDGHSFFWSPGHGTKSLEATRRLSELYEAKRLRRVIVVAIHSINRDREYSHAAWEIMREYGDVEKYSLYLAEELKPFIDAHYRTLPSAAHTALVGSDLGGLAAIITACSYPQSFGIVAGFSPLVWAGLDDLYNLYPIVETLSSSQLLRIISPGLKDPNTRPKFWLDYGLVRAGGPHNALVEEAVTIRVKELIDLLKRKFGYKEKEDLFTWEDDMGGHDELAWGYRFGLFSQVFFPVDEDERREEDKAWAEIEEKKKKEQEKRKKEREDSIAREEAKRLKSVEDQRRKANPPPTAPSTEANGAHGKAKSSTPDSQLADNLEKLKISS